MSDSIKLKTSWSDYLEMTSYKNKGKYFTDKYGDNNKAKLAQLLTFVGSESDELAKEYTVYENIDDMVFGQFIACENALTKGLDMHIVLELIAISVIRPASDEVFDNTDREKEVAHVSDLRKEDSTAVLNIVNDYIRARNYYVNHKYNGVFYKLKSDDDEEEVDLDEDEKSSEEKFADNWYWYAMIRSLTNEDILRLEDVLMLEMSTIAPELSYKRQKYMIDEARRKREEAIRRTR